ncbi:hypothetical protein QN277_014161 [Acacia crassicarpa]|uniref:Retrotransposon Copia-like N-terminal domain-containing protein n=1 Tax=Acacia crassicarpa TaxID=499986 RepID=A0AAE1N423_9FABA|nr:hypothetical protein QN277_014161 [Acacia crassicarpa]
MASDSTSAQTQQTTSPSVASAIPIPATDLSSPFYIHPNENPMLVLVAPSLDGKNYHGWARAMRMALLSKNKLRFIDVSIPPPPSTDPLFPAWERCNNLVQGWLTRSISPTIAKSILWFDSASEIWTDLRSRFSQSDLFRISDLQEEICNLRQGNLTVSEYFTHLKILWDEMNNIRPLKPCSCGSLSTALRHREEDQVIRFLKGLNEQYNSTKSQIMLLDPLPSITRVFSLVSQQERELHPVSPILPVDSKVLLAKTPRYNPPGQPQKQCSHCGKPPGFKFRNGSVAGTGSSPVVNQVGTQGSGLVPPSLSAPASAPGSTSSSATILPQLSSDQYQRLLSSPPSVNHFSASVSASTEDTLNSTFADDWFS